VVLIRKLLIATIALVAFTGTACGGGSSSSSAAPDASSSGASVDASSACDAGITATDFTGDESFTITTKKDYAFHPNCLIAKSGSTVTINNEDAEAHNFSLAEANIDLTIPSGQSRDQAITLAPGTYYFFCNIHQGMGGTLVVAS
jgi:plastocyanin